MSRQSTQTALSFKTIGKVCSLKLTLKKEESQAGSAILPDVDECCADVTQTIYTWERHWLRYQAISFGITIGNHDWL